MQKTDTISPKEREEPLRKKKQMFRHQSTFYIVWFSIWEANNLQPSTSTTNEKLEGFHVATIPLPHPPPALNSFQNAA